MAYGRTVNSHTFMSRSANHSTKGSRRGFVDVETGVDPSSLLTPAQQRDSLKRKHAALCAERERIKNERGGKGEFERLGVEIFEVQQALTVLNRAIVPDRSAMTFDARFALCARSMLTAPEYERISEAARRGMIEGKTP